jgi:hypothetical protein
LNSALNGKVVDAIPRPLYLREKDPAPIVLEEGRPLVSVWTDEEKIFLIGIRYPDCPALSESLY